MSWSFSSSSRAAFFRAAGPAAVVADWPASSPLPELPSGKRAIWSSGVKAGVDFEALPVRKLFASGTSAAPRSSTAIEMAGQFGIRTRAGRTRRLPVFYDAETPVNRYPEGFCLSSIILSPPNGNVKMSPHETGDIHVESEGTTASERNQRMHQGRHGVCQSRRTPMSERAPD